MMLAGVIPTRRVLWHRQSEVRSACYSSPCAFAVGRLIGQLVPQAELGETVGEHRAHRQANTSRPRRIHVVLPDPSRVNLRSDHRRNRLSLRAVVTSLRWLGSHSER